MPPNIKIYLFTPATDQSRERVCHEISGPAFARLKPPLLPSCGGGMEPNVWQNSLYEAGVHLQDCGNSSEPEYT